jgi:glucoamylase
MEPLEVWMERQYRHSAVALMRSVSPVHIVKTRAGFGQTIRPRKGSIVASPVLAAYDPEPDYFFHWYRDSAIVMDALRLLHEDARIEIDALAHFSDFVQFSLSLGTLDGRTLTGSQSWRLAAAPDYQRFLRNDEDLGSVQGEAVAGETRVNPDGSLDISQWPRPQYDGPAMRALTLLRWRQAAALDADLIHAVDRLLRADLALTHRHWRDSCYDIWEEEKGHHYYTLRTAAAALDGGATWFAQQGLPDAESYRSTAQAIRSELDDYWLQERGYIRSRVLESGARSAKELDISVILAVLHASGTGDSHSVSDPRMHATLARLEALFDAEYAINRNRPTDRAPAMGRYEGDVYYSGGAYYFSTLAAAEFCFCAAARSPAANALREHGDAFLETVRAYTPPSGEMSEQFDQRTGAQCSAQQLAWSYAAFISCAAARRQAVR